MPQQNRFRHQAYPPTPTKPPQLKRVRAIRGDDGQFEQLHTVHQIRRVILIPGTFMGDDPLGISDALRSVAERVGPLKDRFHRLADKLAEATRPMVSAAAGDIGNFAEPFRDRFQRLVGDDPVVEILNPQWSGQNHHLARADLAVRLLVRLADVSRSAEERVLLWGHSHAGNGIALLTNLLANHAESVHRFFQAAAENSPHWLEARRLLRAASGPLPLAKRLDVVTFGTPVRYGWDTAGCRRLVHVLHHREPSAAHPWRTQPLFPPHSLQDTLNARFGDWVQAFAVAGTDVPSVTARAAHGRLEELLQSGLEAPAHGVDTRFILPARLRDTCARWKTGTRCHADGQNLLLNYEPCGRTTRLGQAVEHSMLGHGVATTIDWLPAHLALTLQALGEPPDSPFEESPPTGR